MDEEKTKSSRVYCSTWYERVRKDPVWVENNKKRRKERYQENIKDDAWRLARNKKQREINRKAKEKKQLTTKT